MISLFPTTAAAARRALLLALLLLAAIPVADRFAPRVTFVIDPSKVLHESGNAFTVKIPTHGNPILRPLGEDAVAPPGSDLRVWEDGRLLAQPRAPHDDIRSRGAGAYSHWARLLYFSASDNSDPRTNGRPYRIQLRLQVSIGLRFFAWFAALTLTMVWVRAETTSRFRMLFLDFHGARESLAVTWTLLLAIAAAAGASLWDWSCGGGGELTVMGILPLSDAHYYWLCASELAGTGDFLSQPDWCARRMLYPSFLAGLLSVTGWRFQLALLLQTTLVALAICALARETARLAGVFGALMALGLMGVYAWPYGVGTTMSEPLGLTLTAAGLAMALRGVRTLRPLSIYLGIAAIGLGMATRPGAVLALPLVLFWAAWAGRSWGHRRWVAGSLGAVALGLGPLTQRALVSVQGLSAQPFGNFSTTLYGLSKGGTGYDSAYSDYPDLFRRLSEGEAFRRIYDFALANLREDPWVLLPAFSKNLVIAGEQAIGSLPGKIWVAAGATGLMLCLLGRWGERGALVAAGILGLLLSIPVIYVDGGIRVFAATTPFVAVVIALGTGAWATWVVSWGRSAADRRNLSARAGDESGLSLDAGLAMAVPLLLILVPYSSFAVLGRLAVATGEQCGPGEQVLVTRPGRETIGLVVLAAERSDAARPSHGAARDLLLNDLHGNWYEQDFRRLTADTVLLHAIQRGLEGHGRALSVVLSPQGWAMDGEFHTLCLDPEKQLSFGGSEFVEAPYRYARPAEPLANIPGKP